MSKTVAASPEDGRAKMARRGFETEFSLYGANGSRKYLNQYERARVLAEMAKLPPERALFCLTLAWTGARVSEVLALTASSFQVERGVVAIRTLKRRRHHVREVPIPSELVVALNAHFGLAARQRSPRHVEQRLWPWHRATAWRVTKGVMHCAGVTGQHASPRGLRHAFGIGTLQSGIPLNLTQRWMGHARLSTTAIYANASGPEELLLAMRYWTDMGGLPPLLSCRRDPVTCCQQGTGAEQNGPKNCLDDRKAIDGTGGQTRDC
jgi:integrase